VGGVGFFLDSQKLALHGTAALIAHLLGKIQTWREHTQLLYTSRRVGSGVGAVPHITFGGAQMPPSTRLLNQRVSFTAEAVRHQKTGV